MVLFSTRLQSNGQIKRGILEIWLNLDEWGAKGRHDRKRLCFEQEDSE